MPYVYIPDPSPNSTNCPPPASGDPLKDAKTAVRYYKSILAEHKREQEKKEKDKPKIERWYSKITKTQLATFLFFTWWIIPLYLIYTLQFLRQALEATIK